MDAARSDDFVYSFFQSCEAASRADQIEQGFVDALLSLGIRYVFCGVHASLAALSPAAGSPANVLVSNYPKEWMNTYLRRGYVRNDPVLLRSASSRDAFSWDDAGFRTSLSERQRRMMREARRYQIAHGFTAPILVRTACSASLTIISETGDMDQRVQAIAVLLSTILIRRLLLLQETDPYPDAAGLSLRERECLELKAHGADDAAIARALSISPSTVARHLDKAKERLGVRTREHAVYRAAMTGQIS